jgi:hypothetical protein
MLFAVGAQRADVHQTSHVILRTIQEQSADPQIAAYKILEPSWVFYAGRPIEELSWREDEQQQQSAGWRVADHLANNPEGFVITTSDELAEVTLHLPRGVAILAETDLFLKGKRLVLLGHAREGQVAAHPSATNQPR